MAASCAPNANMYKGMSATGTDAALLVQLNTDMNASLWDAALTDYGNMSANAKAVRSTQFLYAQVLAGKCGFDFLSFFTSLGAANFGASPMLLWLMQAYKGKKINMVVPGSTPTLATDSPTGSYCAWSQKVMDDIFTANGGWNADEQMFVFVYNLAKMGMILRYWADTNGVGLLGDGTPDATFDSCKTASMADFYATQLVTSFSLVLHVGPTAMPAMAAVLNALYSLCTGAFPATGLQLALCDHTTPATVTALDIKNMRGLTVLYQAAAPPLGFWSAAPGGGQTVAATDPAPTALWQCNGLGAVAGTLGCCP